MKEADIRSALLTWYDANKRVLPWRGTHDPYEIWVSEIMLQQTRIETVERYYAPFLEAFPTVRDLAAAEEQEVLKMWEGLGYYRRARAMLQGAREIAEQMGGRMPEKYEDLVRLSGIGTYTAGAIASIAWDQPVPAVDGNAVRVYSRLAGYDACVDTAGGKKDMWDFGRRYLDPQRPGDFNQAVMDLGSGICTPLKPACSVCPLRAFCACPSPEAAEKLPVKKEKKKQTVEEWDVLLVLQGRRIAVVQRKEELLFGMWTFPMQRHTSDPSVAEGTGAAREVGRARHVFSHIIWDMHLIVMPVSSQADLLPEWRMATADELSSLPFPSAMKAALKEAHKQLKERT